jgi:hypothetical protein
MDEQHELVEDEDLINDLGDGEEGPRQLDADVILDTLVPSTIDWRGSVRRHPLISVATVGVVGYMVGRTKGSTIMAGLTAALSTALTRQLGDVFDGEFFDF